MISSAVCVVAEPVPFLPYSVYIVPPFADAERTATGSAIGFSSIIVMRASFR